MTKKKSDGNTTDEYTDATSTIYPLLDPFT